MDANYIPISTHFFLSTFDQLHSERPAMVLLY